MAQKRDDKRKKFEQPKKKNSTPLLIGLVALIAIGGFIAYSLVNSGSKAQQAAKATFQTGTSVAYTTTTQQTDVTNTVQNNQISLALSDVKNDHFVRTFYDQSGKNVPLTAFLNTNGNLVVAVSVCEPCNGKSFRIEGNKIICNVCGTTWDLNTLQGISGGCTNYPPETLNYKVDGNKIVIDESLVKNWQPRT